MEQNNKNKKQKKKKFYSVGEWVWIIPRKQKGLVVDINPKEKNVIVQYSYKENGKEKWASNLYKFWEIDKTEQPSLRGEKGMDKGFAQVREFHQMTGQPVAKSPEPMSKERALFRMIMTNEELVEFLYATVKGDIAQFDELVDGLIEGTNIARAKMKEKGEVIENVLVAQVDASTDAKYLMLGTDVEIGVYPQEMQDIVHAANLGKKFPDGKAHFNGFGKVIKPDYWEKDYAPEPKLRIALEGQIRRAEQRNKKHIEVRSGKDNQLLMTVGK